MVFDAHSDLLYDVTRRRLLGERRVLERHHLDRLRRGGVEGLVLAVWASGPRETFWKDTSWGDPVADLGRTHQMLSCARAELAECPQVRLVRTGEEAATARAAGQLYAFLAVQIHAVAVLICLFCVVYGMVQHRDVRLGLNVSLQQRIKILRVNHVRRSDHHMRIGGILNMLQICHICFYIRIVVIIFLLGIRKHDLHVSALGINIKMTSGSDMLY